MSRIYTDSARAAKGLEALGVPVEDDGHGCFWYPLRAALFLSLVFGEDRLRRVRDRTVGTHVAHGLRRALKDYAFWQACQTAFALGGASALYDLLNATLPANEVR